MSLQSLEMYTQRLNVSFFSSHSRLYSAEVMVLLQREFLAFWALEACKLKVKKFWMFLGIIFSMCSEKSVCAGTPDHKKLPHQG